MCIKSLNKAIKKLDIWDMQLIKMACVAIGIIIGAYIAAFAKQYLWIFIVLAVLFAIRPAYKYLKK